MSLLRACITLQDNTHNTKLSLRTLNRIVPFKPDTGIRNSKTSSTNSKMSDSEINIRVAELRDCDNIVEFLNSRKSELSRQQFVEYSQNYVKSLLVGKTSRIFVAEEKGMMCGVLVVIVVDSSTTLVLKDLYILEKYKGSGLSEALLNAMYKYTVKHFRRVKRERFVSSFSDFSELFQNNGKGKEARESFTKILELDQIDIEIPVSEELSKKLDSLVRKSGLVHMTKKEADLYLLRNLLNLSAENLLVDSVPYTTQLSNIDTVFTNGEYLIGEKQSNQKDLSVNNFLRAPSPNVALSGRNSPTRLQTSHVVNLLDNLHSNLQGMNASLSHLQNALQESLPKSFSHGKEKNIQESKIWELTIYSKEYDVFRAHVLEQLRVASIHIKDNFQLTMKSNCSMITEAKTLFTEELGLDLSEHERKTVAVYERRFELSLNGFVH